MAPILPSSLSPHICVLSTPDLKELLASHSLPPLPQVLQSLSPLRQVSTHTTSFTTVPHSTFAVRFSDLLEIETGCREDEERRAARTIDWITARIAKRSARWVEDMEGFIETEPVQTPWWDEVRHCIEGDNIPSKAEGWNHPVSILIAVSTTGPNPLQAVTALHSRRPELPPWVDSNILFATVIIHPRDSPLSDEEVGALFNAVRKQYGPNVFLLPLSLPPSPTPINIPLLGPRLPPPSFSDSSTDTDSLQIPDPKSPVLPLPVPILNTLLLVEADLSATAKFAREYVVQALLPWMEKCVFEWNENYTSTRRLPSRLFSSTKRLFGSTSPSPSTPVAPPPSSNQAASRSHTFTGSQSSITSVSGVVGGPPSQQRRLAEFATILGDFKLAISVWESLRKEGRGGSDLLPILLTPSTNSVLHASNAISSIHPPTPELPALAQVRALQFAVRWEIGIGFPNLLDDILEAEKWFVWAAGNVEEAPFALLLARAANLSVRKGANRSGALWYLSAGNKLEKCGIVNLKPLTMYFLRRAHALYKNRSEKELSPLFWESENRTPRDGVGFDAIMAGIEHPLGRIMYTSGDVAGAVRFFLGLLRGSSIPNTYPLAGESNGNIPKSQSLDNVFLEDFRLAFSHFKNTGGDLRVLSDLKLPFTLCNARETRVRLAQDVTLGDTAVWEEREEQWRSFWKLRGKEVLEKSGKAFVDEACWVQLVISNPLDADITLSDLTLVVEETGVTDGEMSTKPFLDVECIDEITLAAKETRTVPVSIISSRTASLIVTHITYSFLSLLPAKESLASRGRRLHDTPAQRQKPTYAPDNLVSIQVGASNQKLFANFVDNSMLELGQGETILLNLWLSNGGGEGIGELWMVAGTNDSVWVHPEGDTSTLGTSGEVDVFQSSNSLAPGKPMQITFEDVEEGNSVLEPGDSKQLRLALHAQTLGSCDLCLLFVYRETNGKTFRTLRIARSYEVEPVLEAFASARPSKSPDHLFTLFLELENVYKSANAVQISQITSMSPLWSTDELSRFDFNDSISHQQTARLSFGADPWCDGEGSEETYRYVYERLRGIVSGSPAESIEPPPIDVLCTHLPSNPKHSMQNPTTRHFIHCARQSASINSIVATHPHIPVSSLPYVFPLYNPSSVDFLVFWKIPTQQRKGQILVSGLRLGAGHAALNGLIESVENTKVKRNMYAETQREKSEIVESVRNCEWNLETNPLETSLGFDTVAEHDFSSGPFQKPLAFAIRNFSLTHTSRFVLKMETSSVTYPPPSNLLPPQYLGRTTYRGTVGPTETVTVRPNLWVTRPGSYALNGWSLETEVGELDSVTVGGIWRTRHRYLQVPSADDKICLTIRDMNRSVQ